MTEDGGCRISMMVSGEFMHSVRHKVAARVFDIHTKWCTSIR